MKGSKLCSSEGLCRPVRVNSCKKKTKNNAVLLIGLFSVTKIYPDVTRGQDVSDRERWSLKRNREFGSDQHRKQLETDGGSSSRCELRPSSNERCINNQERSAKSGTLGKAWSCSSETRFEPQAALNILSVYVFCRNRCQPRCNDALLDSLLFLKELDVLRKGGFNIHPANVMVALLLAAF